MHKGDKNAEYTMGEGGDIELGNKALLTVNQISFKSNNQSVTIMSLSMAIGLNTDTFVLNRASCVQLKLHKGVRSYTLNAIYN